MSDARREILHRIKQALPQAELPYVSGSVGGPPQPPPFDRPLLDVFVEALETVQAVPHIVEDEREALALLLAHMQDRGISEVLGWNAKSYATLGIEDALAQGSYDLLYVDGQHTPFSDEQLVAFCALAEDLGLPVQFRIPHTRHTYLIGRYLDMGVSAIMVPEVSEAAVVDEAIATCYYPPLGRRSWGGAARVGLRARGGRVDRLEYAAWLNDHVILAIQLESVGGIVNARKLATPGVDYVIFGPNDLMFSLEGHPEFPLRTVEACVRHVAEQLRGSGVKLGIPASIPHERDKYLEIGVTILHETPSN